MIPAFSKIGCSRRQKWRARLTYMETDRLNTYFPDTMATPAYLKAFRDFLVSSPGFGDLPAMEVEFYAGSDRPAVILQASNVENILQSVVEKKMRQPLTVDLRERLFDHNGPLATFSNKILVGYALGLFGSIFRHDLDLIRELRNGFAHARHPMTLSTPQVAQVCKFLKLPDDKKLRATGPQAYYDRFPDLAVAADQSHPRTRFTVACHTISVRLLEAEHALSTGVAYTLP
jgi:hypothetical protein